MLRKVARGALPVQGNVLVRRREFWTFSPATPAGGALQFNGGQANPRVVGGTGTPIVRGIETNLPGLPVYENRALLGQPDTFTLDFQSGIIEINEPGIYVITGSLTYDALNQESILRVIGTRGDTVVVIGNSKGNLSLDPVEFLEVLTISVAREGDTIHLEFGRADGQLFANVNVFRAALSIFVLSYIEQEQAQVFL
jgi:hypothetical protein